jgi:hypothetical protein
MQRRPPLGDLANYPHLHRKTWSGRRERTLVPNLGKYNLRHIMIYHSCMRAGILLGKDIMQFHGNSP